MNKQAIESNHSKKLAKPENNNLHKNSIPPPPPSHILINGEREFCLTSPTILFNDQLIVEVGDINFHLIFYGEGHTNNDILIYIPEVKLLIVGDLFYKKSLPQFSNLNKLNVTRWISCLRLILDKEKPIEYVIPGHNEMFSKIELEQYLEYINTLWIEMNLEVANKKSLDEIKRKFSLGNRFPDLVSKDMKNNKGLSLHEDNIEAFWNILNNNKQE